MRLELPADIVPRWTLLCGAVAPLLLMVFLVVAGLVTPGYSHVSDAISQLGAADKPHPEVMNAGFAAYGLLLICFACGLQRLLGRGAGSRACCYLLYASGVCTMLTAVFNVDPSGVLPSTEGSVHAVLAQAAFLTFLVAVAVFGRITRQDRRWRGFVRMSLVVVLASLVTALLFWAEVSPDLEGALQRSFGAVSLLWVEAVSMRSLKLQSALVAH